MKKWRFVYLGAVVSALVIGFGLWSPLKQAVANDRNNAPRFKVDPFWPKPLPSDVETNPAAATDGNRTTGPGATKPWVTGEVAGHGIDSNDHVFIVTRGPQGNLVSPETVIAHPSPSVVEFDRAGNVVNSWPPNIMSATAPWWTAPIDPVGCDGSPACHGALRGVPQGIHGLFVDYQDNVWIAGNGDGIVQKYSHDGSRLLLQIGMRGVCDNPPANTCGNSGANLLANMSHTLLNEPANMYIDPNRDPVTGQRGSIYIADGYGNHRVVVFSATGTWLRQWGGVAGTMNHVTDSPGLFASGDGGHPHCITIGNDDLVYVCDRADDRIQVFTKTGVLQRIIPVVPGTGVTLGIGGAPGLGTAGSAWDLAFSNDDRQTFMFEVDGGNEILHIMDRAMGTILSGFGAPGLQPGQFTFLHSVVLDSKGNLYTGETINGRRIQKFTRVECNNGRGRGNDNCDD